MIIIFSPTKLMHFDSPPKSVISDSNQVPEFLKEALSLNESLSLYSAEALTSLMKMSPALAEQTRQSIFSFHKGSLQEAIYSYRGTSFQSLNASSLSQGALDFAQKHLRILSGMYGCLRPLDRISPYRLEMKTALSVGGEKNLSSFWKVRVNAYLKSSESLAAADSVILNLASGEYSRIIDTKRLNRRMITLHFKEKTTRGYKTVGMYAKAARGAMVRRILEDKTDDPEKIMMMKVNNYEFSRTMSDEDSWVFIRESNL